MQPFGEFSGVLDELLPGQIHGRLAALGQIKRGVYRHGAGDDQACAAFGNGLVVGNAVLGEAAVRIDQPMAVDAHRLQHDAVLQLNGPHLQRLEQTIVFSHNAMLLFVEVIRFSRSLSIV